MCPNIKMPSITSLVQFYGYNHFDHIHKQLNMTSFSKIIRTSTNSALYDILKDIKIKWKKWHSNYQHIFDKNNPIATLKKNSRYDIALRWYLTAKAYNISDINMLEYGQHLQINTNY